MGKKRRGKMPAWGRNVMHGIKIGLKAYSHIFTVAGVLVASEPLLPGLVQAAQGNVSGAGTTIRNSTIGSQPGLTDSIKSGIVQVGIPAAIGIGLIFVGTQIRKRIGN